MMRSKNTIFFTFIILFNLCYGQFRSEIPLKRVPSNLNGQLDSGQYFSIFDLDKFEMNQSFNMSMITTGVESFSLLSFSNQMSYSPMKNLKLNADVTIYNNPSAFQNRKFHIRFGCSIQCWINFSTNQKLFFESSSYKVTSTTTVSKFFTLQHWSFRISVSEKIK